jgi:hypothetical protein
MRWLALLAALAAVGFGGNLGRLEVRFEGYLNGDAARIHPLADITIRIADGELQQFALTDIVMLSPGDVSGTDVLFQMTPVKPSFIFAGDKELTDKIRTALPNQLLKITGYTGLGDQYVLVNLVDRSAPITGPTPTQSLREKFLGF